MEETKNKLAGKWQLLSLNGSNIVTTKAPTLLFSARDFSLTGHGGCNNYFGDFTISTANEVIISAVGSTRKACMDDNIENDFFKAISEQSFTVKRNFNSLKLQNETYTLRFMLVED